MNVMQIKNKTRKPLQRSFLELILKKRYLIPVLLCIGALLVQARLMDPGGNRADQATILAYINRFNPQKTSQAQRRQLATIIIEESGRLHIPTEQQIDGRPINRAFLLAAYIRVESAFYPGALSTSDARGYMQLKMNTASWIAGKNGRNTRPELFKPRQNIVLGVDYINYLNTMFLDTRLSALAYNAGPASVQRGYFHEDYWEKILHTYRLLQSKHYDQAGIKL